MDSDLQKMYAVLMILFLFQVLIILLELLIFFHTSDIIDVFIQRRVRNTKTHFFTPNRTPTSFS